MNNQPVQPRSTAPWSAIFTMFVGLLYGASPIDLIPDLIPLLGWVDDAAIVPIMLILAFFQYRRHQKRSAAQSSQLIVAKGSTISD